VDSRGPGHSPEKRKVGGSTPPLSTTLASASAEWFSSAGPIANGFANRSLDSLQAEGQGFESPVLSVLSSSFIRSTISLTWAA